MKEIQEGEEKENTIKVNEEKENIIHVQVDDDLIIKGKHVITGPSYLNDSLLSSLFSSRWVSRSILITDRPLPLPVEPEISSDPLGPIEDFMITIPPNVFSHPFAITLIQLSSGMCVCPVGVYVVYIMTYQHVCAKDDLAEVVNCFFTRERAIPKNEEGKGEEKREGEGEGEGQKEGEEEKGEEKEKPWIMWEGYYSTPFYEKKEQSTINSFPFLLIFFLIICFLIFFLFVFYYFYYYFFVYFLIFLIRLM